MCVLLFVLVPTASKRKGGTKTSSDEEILPSSTRKVTCERANMKRRQPPLIRGRDAVWRLGENYQETTTFIETGQGDVGQQAEHRRQTVRVLLLLHLYQVILSSVFFYSCRSCLSRLTCVCRSNRKPLVTPARNLLDSSLMMGATPLITPRFDPR